MIIKKFFFLLIFFSLTACGYQAIYSQKNITKIKISEINSFGEKKINRLILSFITPNIKETNKNGYILNLTSKKNKETIVKDSSGTSETFKITLNVSIKITEDINKKIIYKNKQFNANFIYANKNDKFELSQDEKNIEANLSETIAAQIIVYLNS
tara:strand:+ start:63 stop:527 length:465 start_codon:yes stop_codon:yes gene_type:complete